MKNGDKKNIVVSAINVVDSGALAILTECLAYLSRRLKEDYNIIALVNDRSRFAMDGIVFYDFPESKKSWVNRLYYEYIYFKKLSLKLNPYLWLSLHDMTPNVKSEIRAVYCHHPSPFYDPSLKELVLDPLFGLFHFSYKYLYGINIRDNDYVIVQQDCLRKKFRDAFHLKNIIVAYPEVAHQSVCAEDRAGKKDKHIFFYPSLPRVFKNFEVICEAVKNLPQEERAKMELYLTINGRENIYSKYIYGKYKDVDAIKFLGAQPRDKIFEYYKTADYLIFPSKIETWGMPITEFKLFDKPIFLADMAYGRETLGQYDKAVFFDPADPAGLSGKMRDLMKGDLVFEKTRFREIDPPFAAGWEELFDILLNKRS